MSLLHLSKMSAKGFATGIPEPKISPLPKVSDPQVWEFSAHPHHAEKAGLHIDMRLGNTKTGVAHSFVLPKTDKLPGPGEATRIIPTFDHEIPYMNFTGPLKGYGQGVVVQGRRSVAEVHHSDPSEGPGTKLRFNLYDGPNPEEFSIRLDKTGKWFLHNKTQTRERRPDIPSDKSDYKEISVNDVDHFNSNQAMMAKLDGAHAIIDLKEGRSPRVYSYREAKVSPTGLIEHTHKLTDLMAARVPKELDGTVLRAEILGVKNGKAIPAEQIGGLLNSKVWESRRKQDELGVSLQAFPFNVVKFRGRDLSDTPFDKKLEILKLVQSHIPELSHPPLAVEPEEKIGLLNSIKAGKHPLTSEGVVLVDRNNAGASLKAKFAPDFDVVIRDVHPAIKGGTKELHNRAGSVSYSWTPNGPIVGQFGGFKHEEARDMLLNPDKYVGRVAKVQAAKVFGEGKGALFQPRFKEWHLDKGDIEKGAELYHYTGNKEEILRSGKLLPIDETDPSQVENYQGRGKTTEEILRKAKLLKPGEKYENYGVYLTPLEPSSEGFRSKDHIEVPESAVSHGAIQYRHPETRKRVVVPYSQKALEKARNVWNPEAVKKYEQEVKSGKRDTHNVLFWDLPQVVSWDSIPVTKTVLSKTSALYHGSPSKLDVLEPKNLHGDPDVKDAIFASPSRTFALAYSGGKWGDRDIEQSTRGSLKKNPRMILREMRPGALEDIYKTQGYLYHLPEESFEALPGRRTTREVISSQAVHPEKIETIPNVLEALKADPSVTFEAYDPKSKGTARAIKRAVQRMKEMPSGDREGYLRWRMERATPEISEMLKQELEKQSMFSGFVDELQKITSFE